MPPLISLKWKTLLPIRAPLRPEAAEAAAVQGRFWEIHELLFANPDRLTDRNLFGHARKPGLDEGTYRGRSPASRRHRGARPECRV